jgi:hypothetical protein
MLLEIIFNCLNLNNTKLYLRTQNLCDTKLIKIPFVIVQFFIEK